MTEKELWNCFEPVKSAIQISMTMKHYVMQQSSDNT